MAVRALGGRAVRGAAGGAALLACEARYLRPAPGLPPLRIRWYHAGRLLDDQVPTAKRSNIFALFKLSSADSI